MLPPGETARAATELQCGLPRARAGPPAAPATEPFRAGCRPGFYLNTGSAALRLRLQALAVVPALLPSGISPRLVGGGVGGLDE